MRQMGRVEQVVGGFAGLLVLGATLGGVVIRPLLCLLKVICHPKSVKQEILL